MGLSITHNYTKKQVEKLIESGVDLTNNSELHKINHEALDKYLEVE